MNADMRTLVGGIALILLVGIAGFVYRNALEQPSAPGVGACTMDAKICPDGSSVGRIAPVCAFAACPFPNVEHSEEGMAYAVPQGYEPGTMEPWADGYPEGLVGFYQKPAGAGERHFISAHRFPIPPGETAETVMLRETVLEPSGMNPESMSEFSPRIIGSRTYLAIGIERFEGHAASRYYFPREKDVLAFDVVEVGVADWTDPELIVDNLPEHQALLRMLATLETAPE